MISARKYYTANVYSQSTDKLIFLPVDSTQWFCNSFQRQSLVISTYFCLWSSANLFSVVLEESSKLLQVQAIGMYGAAQPDFFKSETAWGIKIIITHHLYIFKRCVFTPNLEGVTQKISLPRPWEVWNGQGRGSVIFQTILFKFCEKLTSLKIFKW